MPGFARLNEHPASQAPGPAGGLELIPETARAGVGETEEGHGQHLQAWQLHSEGGMQEGHEGQYAELEVAAEEGPLQTGEEAEGMLELAVEPADADAGAAHIECVQLCKSMPVASQLCVLLRPRRLGRAGRNG